MFALLLTEQTALQSSSEEQGWPVKMVGTTWRAESSRQAGLATNLVSQLNPSRQLRTTQPLARSPPQRDGGENRKGKSEKTGGLR